MVNVFLLYCSFPVWRTYKVAEMAPKSPWASNDQMWSHGLLHRFSLQNIANNILPYAQKNCSSDSSGSHCDTHWCSGINIKINISYIVLTICMHLPMSNMTTVIWKSMWTFSTWVTKNQIRPKLNAIVWGLVISTSYDWLVDWGWWFTILLTHP